MSLAIFVIRRYLWTRTYHEFRCKYTITFSFETANVKWLKIIVDDIELTFDIFNVVSLFGISRALSASSAPITADVCSNDRIQIELEI